MTEEEHRNKYKNQTTGQLIVALLVLVLKFLLASILRFIIKIIKVVVFFIKLCKRGIRALIEFWNSNDTQEKKRKLIVASKRGCRNFISWCKTVWAYTKKYAIIGAKYIWKYLCIGSRLFAKYLIITLVAIWHGILWTLRTTKDLIIHSKPTFIRLGKSIKQGCIDFGHWLVRTHRGMKLRRIRRRRAWQNFRRTKGFKGMLVDMGNGLSSGIESYMSEEETESNPEAVTEDDIFAEEIEKQADERNNITKRFFTTIKNIVEDD